jgi:hypothetical protein
LETGEVKGVSRRLQVLWAAPITFNRHHLIIGKVLLLFPEKTWGDSVQILGLATLPPFIKAFGFGRWMKF